MPQFRYRSGGFTPPFSGWRGKPAATFEVETEALLDDPAGRFLGWDRQVASGRKVLQFLPTYHLSVTTWHVLTTFLFSDIPALGS
jgi:hypothetical protein